MKSLLDNTVKVKHIFIFVMLLLIVSICVFIFSNQIHVGELVLACSTLIAPLAALQIQVYVEGLKSKETKKMDIFKTLMATRATPLNFDHVKAINMINVEFYSDTEVINVWKQFLDIRNRTNLANPTKELEDSLVVLLQKMAACLGLNFYDDEIRKGCYRPQAHVDLEEAQLNFLLNQIKALKDGKLHVLIEFPPQVGSENESKAELNTKS